MITAGFPVAWCACATGKSLKFYFNMADYDNRGYGWDRYRGSFDGYDTKSDCM